MHDKLKRRAGFVALVLAVGLVTGSQLVASSEQHTTADSTRAVTLSSPDGRYVVSVSLDDAGHPVYQLDWSGRQVISLSALGMDNGQAAADHLSCDGLLAEMQGEMDRRWQPVWGERASIRDHYHGMRLRFAKGIGLQTWELEVRAYDEGVAFRYHFRPLPSAPNRGATGEVRIQRELTEFRFTGDHRVWAVTSAQGKYSRRSLSELRSPIERPCVIETKTGLSIAVAEAALVDFARMRLARSPNRPHTLQAALHSAVTLGRPSASPWRVVMVAESPCDLLQHNSLLLNLNKPCALRDTSWIRPGKVIREVSLSTAGGKACVDFAVKHGLQYIEYDAGWYGNERDEASDARTVSRPDLDLSEVIRYARQHDIGVLLYVNRRELERRLDELLPLYKSWGVAGLKYGFVQVGSQHWTDWLHEAVRKAAEHKLMVDVHDEYRMTGYQRTYPNFMTAEGIGGDETRPSNEQVLINLFTRMIAAPADHTFCYYTDRVDETASHASQLAKSVCLFSPWQFLFWYDRPDAAHDEPELEFFARLPTSWDETRILQGDIGQFAVVARRSGNRWFVGCLNANQPRTLKIPLDFLQPDMDYSATVYQDDKNVATHTRVGIRHKTVTSESMITCSLSDHGGATMIIEPSPSTDRRPADGS